MKSIRIKCHIFVENIFWEFLKTGLFEFASQTIKVNRGKRKIDRVRGGVKNDNTVQFRLLR